MTNSIYRVNIKISTCLSNPFIRKHNSTSINIIKKTYNFNNRHRLFTFSRNTISNLNIKTFFFKLFNRIIFRNKITPTRYHNLSISLLFNIIFVLIFVRQFIIVFFINFFSSFFISNNSRMIFKFSKFTIAIKNFHSMSNLSNLSSMPSRKFLSSNITIKYCLSNTFKFTTYIIHIIRHSWIT